MYNIEIKNCNNICTGNIILEKNKLNIKYGINGTGKTTISRAIEYSKESEKLQELKSYLNDEPAEIKVIPNISKVHFFNEEFINRVVFNEDEVIENSFNVFLKTADYDSRKEQLDNHLQSLKEILIQDKDVIEFRDLLIKTSAKFSRSNKGILVKKGVYKSILSKQNMYNVPSELSTYQEFFENTDINIQWIDWKSKGDLYDIGEHCPYCSEIIADKYKHEHRKQLFKENYKKADVQNLKEILELIESLKSYMSESKYIELVSYIKNDTAEDVIDGIFNLLATEFDLIISRLQNIDDFGRKKIVIADISKIEENISNMEIPVSLFSIFTGEKSIKVFELINKNIAKLKNELISLKQEMGALKGLMQATIKTSQDDINKFLNTAGINYELEIIAEDENNSKTILKQCFSEEKTGVSKIRKHLSWGEKNAFALVLFMYYANAQNPDLIVLDDPISSFDSNKKYAILHRLFKEIGKKDVSFVNKTVLLLTHDFEPITDFLLVGKLNEKNAYATYIYNDDGVIREKVINPSEDVKLIYRQCEEIAINSDINMISRIAFLRKLCELNEKYDEWGNAYEILSCLIHTTEIRRKIGEDSYADMPKSDVECGMQLIKRYIADFNYDDTKNTYYTIAGIKSLYDRECNQYFKLQLFRELKEIANGKQIKLSGFDEAWFKFIDETYHIENDYLHFLNVVDYNIVPSYISKRVDLIMDTILTE